MDEAKSREAYILGSGRTIRDQSANASLYEREGMPHTVRQLEGNTRSTPMATWSLESSSTSHARGSQPGGGRDHSEHAEKMVRCSQRFRVSSRSSIRELAAATSAARIEERKLSSRVNAALPVSSVVVRRP